MTKSWGIWRPLLVTMACGAVTTAALGSAPSAGASCVSFFGIGNGNGCTSNITSYAIAIGEGAQANSVAGLFSGAVAIGTNANASNNVGLFNFASALGDNATAQNNIAAFGLSLQFGPGSAQTIGVLNLAVGGSAGSAGRHTAGASGLGSVALSLFGAPDPLSNSVALASGLFSSALNIGGDRTVSTEFGVVSTAINFQGRSSVTSGGIFGLAVNAVGDNNLVAVVPDSSPLTASLAFNVFGNGNTVTARGPLGIAGSIFQSGATNIAAGPAVSINGLVIGGGTSTGASSGGASSGGAGAVSGRVAASGRNRGASVRGASAASAKEPAARAASVAGDSRGERRDRGRAPSK